MGPAVRVDSWFANGWIIDGIVAFMVLELLLLIIVRKYRPQRDALPLMVNLGAGAGLLLALRAALLGLGWQAIAAFMLLALAFHLWELALFWSVHRTR